MPPMPMAVTLERAAATRSPQIYGWRFPAEFRARPVGWTERAKPRVPAAIPEPPLQPSSVCAAVPAAFSLDRGPATGIQFGTGDMPERCSNLPTAAPAPALAFAAGGVVAEAPPETPRAPLLALGPPCLLGPAPEPFEASSNAGAARSPAVLDASPPPPLAPKLAQADLLAIGDPASWMLSAPAPRQARHEASYAG